MICDGFVLSADVDAEPSGGDVTYSELVIKPQKKSMRIKGRENHYLMCLDGFF